VTPERKAQMLRWVKDDPNELGEVLLIEALEEVKRLELIALEYRAFQAGASCIRQEQHQLMDALDLALKEVNRLDVLNQSMAQQMREQDSVLTARIVALEEAIDEVCHWNPITGDYGANEDLAVVRWSK
jgi:hypothetical protein